MKKLNINIITISDSRTAKTDKSGDILINLIKKKNLKNNLYLIDGIKNSKIKTDKEYFYDIEPTKLTEQIEEITNYEIRKQNL